MCHTARRSRKRLAIAKQTQHGLLICDGKTVVWIGPAV